MQVARVCNFAIFLLCAIAALIIPSWVQGHPGAETSYPSRFIISLHPESTVERLLPHQCQPYFQKKTGFANIFFPKNQPSVKDFENHLTKLNISYKILVDYTTLVPDVFYGVSLYLDHSEDIALLHISPRVERLSAVKDVFPLKALSSRKLDGPLLSTPETYPPHVQANITDLHRLGIFGQGVRVAILDSGVDCAHPALGSGFGPGKKIAFGLDLVGDKFKGTNDAIRGGSPCTGCSIHGTHVAGIVGAQNAGYGFTGVAPNATLGIYLFGCEQDSQTRDDILLEAILTAYKDGADVITMSLGGTAGWGEGTILSDVINTLVLKKSAIMIASAGNDGEEGIFLASNPASARNVISVGSVDATLVASHSFRTSTHRRVHYLTAIPLSTGSHQMYFTSNSTRTLNDACDPLPQSTPDLSNRVVIIRRGTCYFLKKVEHAQAKGAKLILFYWNATAPASLPTRISNSSVSVITAEDGENLFKEFRENNATRLDFSQSATTFIHSDTGGFMTVLAMIFQALNQLCQVWVAMLSVRTFELVHVQELVLTHPFPATYPLQEGGYASSSGTSMAAPQIAGVTALILSVRGKNFDSLSIRSRLASTSRLVRTDLGKGLLESVVHQGGGLINAFCAVFSNTSVSTSHLALNDSSHIKSHHEFTVSNSGIHPVSYRLTHLPAGAISAFSWKTKYNRITEGVPTPTANYATADIYPESFTLRPGQQQTIRVDVSPPLGLNAEDLTVYSGYISLATATPCESHNVPYHGVVGSMKAQEIGSAYMRMDLAPRDASFANITNVTNYDWKSTFGGVKLLGLIPLSETDFVSRSSSAEVQELVWNATVLDSEQSKPTKIPDGTYRVLLRALRVNGQKHKDADFDTWLSPLIYLRRYT